MPTTAAKATIRASFKKMKQNAKISNTPHNIDLGKVTAPTATVLSYVLSYILPQEPSTTFFFPKTSGHTLLFWKIG